MFEAQVFLSNLIRPTNASITIWLVIEMRFSSVFYLFSIPSVDILLTGNWRDKISNATTISKITISAHLETKWLSGASRSSCALTCDRTEWCAIFLKVYFCL